MFQLSGIPYRGLALWVYGDIEASGCACLIMQVSGFGREGCYAALLLSSRDAEAFREAWLDVRGRSPSIGFGGLGLYCLCVCGFGI